MRNNLTLFFLVLAVGAGCASSPLKEEVSPPRESAEIHKKTVSEFPAAEAEKEARTVSVRELPRHYSAGATVEVTLRVKPVPGTTGVIVNEKLPDNWSIVESQPFYVKQEEGNVYKWLLFDREVKDFVIIYKAAVPRGEEGEKVFTGSVLTHRERVIPTEGDTMIHGR